MKGRPPKPIEQKIREGNAGKRKLPAVLHLGDGSPIEKPDDLPPHAAALWDDLVPILTQANVLNQIDVAALRAMCIQWERGMQAGQVLRGQGLFSLGSTGQMVTHPALEVERAAHQMFLKITPVARSRIAAAAAVAGASMRGELANELDLDL
jgi:P27 family predicted phage terminase small subunit